MGKSYYIFFIIILHAFSFSVEVADIISEDKEKESFVNEKFQFIQDIYAQSWALIIGINKYQNVEPLTYAVDDAEAVRLMLMDNYGFKNENITYIIDEDATKEKLLAQIKADQQLYDAIKASELVDEMEQKVEEYRQRKQ